MRMPLPETWPDAGKLLLTLAALLVAASFALGLPGCSGDDESDSAEPVVLSYQDWRTDWFPPMAQEMLEEFHASHPNIRVFYTPDPENLGTAMLEDMRAGKAPDVFQGCCTFFPIWAQEGFTLDLRPYVEADLDQAIIDEWDKAQYESFFTRDGLQYGLPKYHGALALYYNKDLFDEYGIEYPDGTWDHDDYLVCHDAPYPRQGWRRSNRPVGQHARHLLGPHSDAR